MKPNSSPTLLVRALIILPGLAAVSGCAGQGATKTGFMSSYEGMEPTKEHTADLIYVNPDYVPARYRQAVIDPVGWQPSPDSPVRDPEVIARLEADFMKSLTESLSKSFVIVPLPPPPGQAVAPGTLRIRSAITSTRKANWWINAPVMAIGIGMSAVGLPGLPPPNPGGASEELEAVDATSGQRMAAIATYNNGMPWNVIGNFQEFGHARRAFTIASELLAEQLRPDPTGK